MVAMATSKLMGTHQTSKSPQRIMEWQLKASVSLTKQSLPNFKNLIGEVASTPSLVPPGVNSSIAGNFYALRKKHLKQSPGFFNEVCFVYLCKRFYHLPRHVLKYNDTLSGYIQQALSSSPYQIHKLLAWLQNINIKKHIA